MIESCPKKRMLLGITFLGILTVLVLIVESHWTETRHSNRRKSFVVEQNSTCWQTKKYEIIKDCEPCTAFEIASKTLGICVHTHFKEVLRCVDGELVSRSCDKTAYFDEKSFWRFEGFMSLFGLLSFICVVLRKKVLGKRMLARVQRQLANCV